MHLHCMRGEDEPKDELHELTAVPKASALWGRVLPEMSAQGLS